MPNHTDAVEVQIGKVTTCWTHIGISLAKGTRCTATLDYNTIYNFQTVRLMNSLSIGCLLIEKSHMAKNIETSLRNIICTVRKKGNDFKILTQSG